MKFLCVPCDEAMKLVSTNPPDRGSLTVVYGCPKCSYQMAMLTNPYETQVVGSLGVKVGTGTNRCPAIVIFGPFPALIGIVSRFG